MLTRSTEALYDEDGGGGMENAKTGGERTDKRKYLFSRFLLVLSVVTCGRSRMALKAGEARQTSRAMPGATKEATLSAECGTRTTIVSLQYR